MWIQACNLWAPQTIMLQLGRDEGEEESVVADRCQSYLIEETGIFRTGVWSKPRQYGNISRVNKCQNDLFPKKNTP